MKYFLDTNAFWRVLQEWNSHEVPNLINKLIVDQKLSFFLSEISAMEIHSVLGKYIRGKQNQEIACDRQIKSIEGVKKCNNIWVIYEQMPRLSKLEAQAYIKLIGDLLNNRNPDFDIEIVNLTTNSLSISRNLLERYAYIQDFRSLDATIAGSIVEKNSDEVISVLTADNKFKNVLISEGISCE
jgi:hypothetical protein